MKIKEYLDKSSCNLISCPYGNNIKCKDCVDHMLKEHDEKIRNDVINDFMCKLEDDGVLSYSEEDEKYFRNVAELLKEKENDN